MKITDGHNRVLLLAARTRLSGIQRRLPTEVAAAGVSARAKIPFNALCCREALIWRAEELGRTACDSLEKQDVVAGVLATRALLETAAALWYLKEVIERQLRDGIEPHLEQKVLRLILGHKMHKGLPDPINVLTMISKLATTFPAVVSKYDAMSEYAHPNWTGSSFAFSKIDQEEKVVSFGRGLRGADHHTRLGLVCLMDSLEVAETAYNRIADLMQDFVIACEADLDRQKSK
jgi:hypothetical protein